MEIFKWRRPHVLVFVLFLLAILPGTAQSQITPDDLRSTIDALRTTGYHLFANAIQTADISDLLLAGNSFTLFAPPDGDLYELDVGSPTGADYIRILQHHVVVLKFLYHNLQSLPQGSNLDTLLPGGSVRVTSSDTDDRTVSVDGVRISVPDLYSADRIVVHGVDRVLNRTGFVPSTPAGPITLGGHYPEANSSSTIPSSDELSTSVDDNELVVPLGPAPSDRSTNVDAGIRPAHHERRHPHRLGSARLPSEESLRHAVKVNGSSGLDREL